MKNLLSILSADLQSKIADFNVYSVFVENAEVNVRSEYPFPDPSWMEAIEQELRKAGEL